jgi:glucose-6-phosphate isomerase, archaeal
MKTGDDRPFRVMLDFGTGALVPTSGGFVRRLSDMAGAYEDQGTVLKALDAGAGPVIYSGWDAGAPEGPRQLLFRTTIIEPGTVGDEFYMTKGHHHVPDSAELYIGMSGEGIMLMESRNGDFAHEALVPTASVYVPPGWAHRTVNTGHEPLAFLAIYLADAGHDYGTIERRGFSHRVYRGESGPELRPAPPPDGAGEAS